MLTRLLSELSRSVCPELDTYNCLEGGFAVSSQQGTWTSAQESHGVFLKVLADGCPRGGIA